MVCEVPPVRNVQQEEVRVEARRQSPLAVRPPEDVRRVHRARRERFGRREPELGAREGADERQAFAKGASRVEVRGKRDCGARVDELARGRHRTPEKQRARRQQHADDVAVRERCDSRLARRLEVVDRACAELDRQRDRTSLRELVAVEAQREAGVAARALIDAGAPVALATDFNPGSAFCESLPLVCSLACTQLSMSPAEALVACTVNAAHVLGRAGRIGRVAPGSTADLLLLDVPDWRYLAYHLGGDLGIEPIVAGERALP